MGGYQELRKGEMGSNSLMWTGFYFEVMKMSNVEDGWTPKWQSKDQQEGEA